MLFETLEKPSNTPADTVFSTENGMESESITHRKLWFLYSMPTEYDDTPAIIAAFTWAFGGKTALMVEWEEGGDSLY